MNVLVVGSGGREHALCWQLAASPLLGSALVRAGERGHRERSDLRCARSSWISTDCRPFATSRRSTWSWWVRRRRSAPASSTGWKAEGIAAFGPRKAAARIEGSKGFMKELCTRYGVPTAAYRRVDTIAEAEAFIAELGAPVVVKADGLAAGKGVVLAETEAEALDAAKAMLGGAFGAAGAALVIEEMLEGEEASYFALVDGETVLPLETAQDHKAVGEGDTGPNTGGMGAYSPAPAMTPALCDEARSEHRRAARARPRGGGHALYWRLLRRADAHRRGAEAAGGQRPIRRSGVPGAHAPAQVRPAGGADGGARRRAQGLRPALARRGRALRGARHGWLSGRLREGQRDRRDRRSGKIPTTSWCSTREPPAPKPASSRQAGACSA